MSSASREAGDAPALGARAGETVLDIGDVIVDFPTEHGVVRAVDGVSLTIPAGRRIGIVGESGSGKSTLAFAVLSLLESPGQISAGTIRSEGRDLVGASDDELRRVRGGRISMVFQDALGSLNPVMTIGAQIVEAIRLHADVSRAEARERAAALLGEVGVSTPKDRLNQYPHEFSGGMRQRVMIAMALSSNPSLLIADEPTTALDVTTQASVIDLLVRISDERSMAVLLITHDLGVVAGFAQDVLVMYAGAPVEYGSVDDIFARPTHPYTQALMEAVPRRPMRGRRSCGRSPGRCRRSASTFPVAATSRAAISGTVASSAAPCAPRSTSTSPTCAPPATTRPSHRRVRASASIMRTSRPERPCRVASCCGWRTSPRRT